MLDHIVLNVPASRFDETVTWYLAALSSLGYKKHHDFPGHAAGLGTSASNSPFWIGAKPDAEGTISATHVAFRADDHESVKKFWEDGVKAGGKDNGGPGVRTMYHPGYYAAFVFDPLGNNIEVVNHGTGK